MGAKAGRGNSDVSKAEWIGLVVVIAVLLAGIKVLPLRDSLERAALWIDGLGFWGPLAFVALYVLCTVLLIPRSILTVGAGLQFGFAEGCLWVVLAMNLGANLAFVAGRYFVRDTVAKRMRNNVRFQAMDRAVGRDGWKIVGLTRLSPVFPFAFLNYAYGITRVKWPQYAAGSLLGTFPGILLLVSVGYLTHLAAEAEESGHSTAQTLAFVLGAIVAIVATILITRFAKRTLSRQAEIDLP